MWVAGARRRCRQRCRRDPVPAGPARAAAGPGLGPAAGAFLHRSHRRRRRGRLRAGPGLAGASDGHAQARSAAWPVLRRCRRALGAACAAGARCGAAAARLRFPPRRPGTAGAGRTGLLPDGRSGPAAAAPVAAAGCGRHRCPGRADRGQRAASGARADVGFARHAAGGAVPAARDRRGEVDGAVRADSAPAAVRAALVRRGAVPLLGPGPVRPPLDLPRRGARLRRHGLAADRRPRLAGSRRTGRTASLPR